MAPLKTKFIFLTGGGAAALGKGLISASIGQLLKASGLKVSILRLDPFFNVDKRTIDPALYGEVFVTEDGGEVSFHLGDYERFLNEPLTADAYVTAGQIYYSIIMKERRNGFGGHIVRMFPDVIDEIKSRILRQPREYDLDLLIGEIGGNISDIDTLPFIEAIRQLRNDIGFGNILFIHVVLVPFVKVSKRYETRIAIQSLRELRGWGVDPQLIIARTESFLPREFKMEIAFASNFSEDAIFEAIDVESIYEIPQILHHQGIDHKIVELLDLKARKPDFEEWDLFVQRMKSPFRTCEIAVLSPDLTHRNAFRSLVEALNHAAVANNVKVKIHWVDTSMVTNEVQIRNNLQYASGIVIIGDRARNSIEGELKAVEIGRTQRKPLLGINIGCHAMLIEFARNVCGLKGGDTQELNDATPTPIVEIKDTAGAKSDILAAGVGRLGSFTINIADNSLAAQIYQKREVTERFRDHYGFNPKYLKTFVHNGLVPTGTSSRKKRFEIFELKDHPFFLGVQYHPEFKSKPLAPHPIFYHFIKKAVKYSESVQGKVR